MILGMAWLVACERPHARPPSATAFATIGARRMEVDENLAAARATVLSGSGDVLLAHVFSRDLNWPMNVRLTFKEGNLSAVTYLQPPLARDWVAKTPLGPIGFRTFLDKSVQPPIRDRYVFFGPLGRMYVGTDGLAVHLTAAAKILGAVTVMACACLSALTHRKTSTPR